MKPQPRSVPGPLHLVTPRRATYPFPWVRPSRVQRIDLWLDGHHRIKALLMALVLAPAFTVICIWAWLIVYGAVTGR